MKIENLPTIERPSKAYNREVQGNIYYPDVSGTIDSKLDIVVNHLEEAKLRKIFEVLDHPQLQSLIDEEKITFAAIKPRTNQSKLGVDSDSEGEEMLKSLIRESFIPIFSIALNPAKEDLDEFYPSEVRDRLSLISEEDSNVWDLFIEYMSSGPITYMLLYSESGNAVRRWREKTGATNPLNASSNSIRGKYAIDMRRNLVHGSSGDTHEERINNVRVETEWLKKQVEKTIEAISAARNDKNFIREEELRELGIICESERMILTKRLFDFKRVGAESFLSAYHVVIEDDENNVSSKFIAQKAITTMGSIDQKSKDIFNRLRCLKREGVKTPHLYGVKNGIIFMEYILDVQDSQVGIEIIKSPETPSETKETLVDELVRIAYTLDKLGFKPISFIRDLIFDGKSFILVDGGFDLGPSDSNSSSNISQVQLQNLFEDDGKVLRLIMQKYKSLARHTV